MSTYKDIRVKFQIALNESVKFSKVAIEKYWLDGYISYMDSKDYAGVSSRKGNTGEVLRANFGSNDGTAESKIIEFLQNFGGINSHDYEIENLGVGPISSDYVAYKITFKKPSRDSLGKTYKKKDFFIITNRYKVGKSGAHAIIGKKDLTPDALNITTNEYKSPESLLAAIKPGIMSKSYPDNYTNFIINSSIEIVNNTSNSNKFNNFEAYSSAAVHDIEYKISDELFEGIDEISISNFQNDYGEIIGGFMLFNLLKNVGAGLSYPTASNEKLVDFYFDGYSVSSKAGKGGTPTGDTIIRKIYDLYKSGVIVPDNTKESDFINSVVLEWVNAPNLSSSDIYNNIMNLSSVNITDRRNSGYWFLSDESGLGPAQMTRESVESFLDELSLDKDKFKKFLSELWTKSNLKWNDKMLNSYVDDYSPSNKTKKIGVIFYPIMVEVSKVLNSSYIDELTKFAQMATNIKQLYLDVIVKKGIFKFRTVPFKTATFSFSQKGSISNPFNSNMGISIKK